MPAFDLRLLRTESDDVQRIRIAVERAIATVEQVHALPDLARPVPIQIDPALRVAGQYLAVPHREEIVLRPQAEAPIVTVLHELGHWVDHQGAGRYRAVVMTDDLDGVVRNWWQTVKGSELHLQLELVRRTHPIVEDRLLPNYVRQPSELFARSYMQHIVPRSYDDAIWAELSQYPSAQPEVDDTVVWRWDDKDFEPIAGALDRLIEVLGWSSKSSR